MQGVKGTHDPSPMYVRCVAIRMSDDEFVVLNKKAKFEGRSIASIVRDYITWGLEAEKGEK